MADRKAFKQALRKRHQLWQSGAFSVGAERGVTAVLFTENDGAHPNLDYDRLPARPDGNQPGDTLRRMQQEFTDIPERLATLGRACITVFNPTCSDMERVIQDPHIASLVTIGHGTLSSISTLCTCSHRNDGHGKRTRRFTWKDASTAATHLKRGHWEQRMCGGLLNYPVPLGVFVMENAANVTAPTCMYFDPPDIDHPANEQLQPVCVGRDFVYDDIVRLRGMAAGLHTPTHNPDNMTILIPGTSEPLPFLPPPPRDPLPAALYPRMYPWRM